MTAPARVRIVPVAVLAAGIAALVAWALREHAEFLPDGRTAPHSLLLATSGGHGHGGGTEVYEPPPAVTGDALANYAGLAMVALHVLLAVVALAARVHRRSSARTHGLVPRLTFAGAVAVTSALVTMAMAAVLLGTAISFAATLAAAVTVLRYAFVLAIVSTAVLGLP